MPNHYNYDSLNHDLIVAGIRMIDYADDIKISIEYEEDFRTVTVGVDGATTTNEKHNRNAKIDISILANSPLNAILTNLAISGKEFPVAHVDRNFNGDIGAFASKAQANFSLIYSSNDVTSANVIDSLALYI